MYELPITDEEYGCIYSIPIKSVF